MQNIASGYESVYLNLTRKDCADSRISSNNGTLRLVISADVT